MQLNSFYPVLLVDDVDGSAAFFTAELGFRETFRSDWYISLVHTDRTEFELAFVDRQHGSVPVDRRDPASNVLLNVEVSDATAAYERFEALGLPVLLPLRDEPWGQRHFIVSVAGGAMLDVIEPIPASAEYAAQYVS